MSKLLKTVKYQSEELSNCAIVNPMDLDKIMGDVKISGHSKKYVFWITADKLIFPDEIDFEAVQVHIAFWVPLRLIRLMIK